MSTHVPEDATARLLLDGEAIEKALSRIAHEIIERNGATPRPDSSARARRDPVARRTARLPAAQARRGAKRRRAPSARSTSRSTATTSTFATADGRRGGSPSSARRASRSRSRG